MSTSEKDLLMAHLAAQRRHVLGILEGLSEEQLRRPVMPSGWHCLGMVKHLALSDEHYWFRCVVGGESPDFFPAGPRADWQVEPGEDVFALYKEEMERADEIIAATDLDAPPNFRDPVWDQWGTDYPNLRSVMLWMITETSIHAGHLDATRELIDGRQWIAL